MTTRVAAVDCGTNSVRLLVADVDPGTGRLVDVDRRLEIVRLGAGVDRTGRLAPDALQRAFAALDRYAAVIRDLGARRVRVVATSATRDASNRQEFVDGVRARLGVPPDVVSGRQEAQLSFDGAVRSLAGPDRPLAAPCLVVDIGGGSTELALGPADPLLATSVDLGCVRLTERHLRSDPPTAFEVAAALAEVDRVLDAAQRVVPLDAAATVVAVAGTATTIAALALRLPAYDPRALHGARVSAAAVAEVTDSLLAMDRPTRAALPVMHPGRVDVIVGGALVLRGVVARSGRPEVVVSEHDILDGIAWSVLAEAPDAGPAAGSPTPDPAGPAL